MWIGPRVVTVSVRMFPYALAALCLWAMVPWGGVARWALASILMATFGVSLLGLFAGSLQPVRSDHISKPERLLWILAILGLFAWGLIQIIPLSADLVTRLQSGAAPLYELTGLGAEKVTLSLNPEQTVLTLITWFAYILLIFSCARFFSTSTHSASRMALLIALVGVLQAVLSMLTHGQDSLFENPFASARFNGTFSGANAFGGLLAITIPISLGVLLFRLAQIMIGYKGSIKNALLDARNGRKLLVLCLWVMLGLILQMVCLMLSASRGAGLATLLVVLIMLIWFALGARKMKAGKALVMLAMVGLAVVIIGFSSGYFLIWERLQSLADDDLSMAIRLSMWASCHQFIALYPFGVGAGAFPAAAPQIQPEGLDDKRFDLAHNDYLQLLCELGWVGLLPVLILAGLMAWRSRFAIQPSRDFSSWILRGLWFGVVAALLHAVVDFNLSSRPGVAITFCVALGTLLGVAQRHRTDKSKKDRPRKRIGLKPVDPELERVADPQRSEPQSRVRRKRRRRSRRKDQFIARLTPLNMLLLFVTLVVCVGCSLHLWNVARASLLVESGRMTAGAAADPYLWLRLRKAAPDALPATFEQAIQLNRDRGWIDLQYGRSLILQYDVEEEKQEEEAFARAGGDISETHIMKLMERTLRRERHRVYGLALPVLEAGTRKAPWSCDAHSFYGRFLCEQALLTQDPTEARRLVEKGMRHLKIAEKLAPDDTTTLLLVTQGLAFAHRGMGHVLGDEIREEMMRLGSRVMLEGYSYSLDVIRTWYDSGVKLSEMISSGKMPIRAMWMVYNLYNQVNDAKNSTACLRAIEAALEEDPPNTGLAASQDPEPHFFRWRQLLLRQQAMWDLRTGNWEAYANSFPARRKAWRDVIDRELDVEGRSDSSIRIVLERKAESVGLPPERALQMSRMEFDEQESKVSEPLLMEMAFSEKLDVQQMAEQAWWTEENLERIDNDGIQLLNARINMERGNLDEARLALLPFFSQRKLPYRFQHRLRWLHGLCQLASGFKKEGEADLARAFELCATDPTILLHLQDIGATNLSWLSEDNIRRNIPQLIEDLTPQHPLYMSFDGGALELTGINLKEISPSGKIELTALWSFWKRVPSDLTMVVSSRAESGYSRFQKTIRFDKAAQVQFGNGQPQVGSMIPLTVELPSFLKQPGSSLRIHLFTRLRGTRKVLFTEEGLHGFDAWIWRDKATPFVPVLE